MNTVLYRRSLSLTSGTGQLIAMQALGLRKAGAAVQIASRRGGFKFFVRTGMHVKRVRGATSSPLNGGTSDLIVDHSKELRNADIVFVHNLMSEAVKYLDRSDFRVVAEQERRYFSELRGDAPIVANSQQVKSGLIENFSLDPARISVGYPGFWKRRFTHSLRGPLRARARRALRIHETTPLIGFVTSGDLHKRGLDIFLAAAQQIAAVRRDARFLVVGSRSLPDWADQHPLIASGQVCYRPKNTKPELWMSALDLFVYPSLFEEFGMVVLEAQALGIPVLTSRRVGAAECLPPEYESWTLSEPDGGRFAERVLALLDDAATQRLLAERGEAYAVKFSDERYASESAAIILAQKR